VSGDSQEISGVLVAVNGTSRLELSAHNLP